MRSYAQNFEDVILWRVLGDVPVGFYIDLGAQHPVQDSVSKFFYEQGWRGIHVEPLRIYSDLLREDRPDEDVVRAGISEEPGELVVYTFPGTGLSTADPDIALTHKTGLGREWIEEIVPAMTLSQLFERAGREIVHWLKIDVEGHERSALASWGSSPVRPWVVLVEATYPNTQVETHQEWEFLLVSRGYMFVYADGLNRYYLHETQNHRSKGFKYPPNYFDHFSLGDHWATHDLREQHRRLLDEAHEARHRAEALAADRDAKYTVAISGLAHDLGAQVAQTTSSLAELSARIDQRSAELQESRDLLRRIAIRSDESTAYLEALSSSIKAFGEEMDSVLSSPWALLRRMMGFRKDELPTRSRRFNAAQKERLTLCPEALIGSGTIQPDAKKLQGLNDVTEANCPSPLTLTELNSLPPKAFVTASYQILLGRAPDATGMSHYMGKLASGDSRADVLTSMVTGREFRRRHSNKDLMQLEADQFIELAFLRMLGRKPDEAGRAHYSQRLRDGQPKLIVLRDIAKSSEARNRFDPVARMRENIRSLAAPHRRLSRWLMSIPHSSLVRQLARLDFSLSTLKDDLDRNANEGRASSRGSLLERLGPLRSQIGRSEPRGDNVSQIPNAALRPRWVPRDIRYAGRDTFAAESQERILHRDFVLLSERMKKDAPFGELQDAAAGQDEIDAFLEGAYPREDHGEGPVRWIGWEGSAYLRVAGPRLIVEATGFFGKRPVLISIGDTVLSNTSFGEKYSVASIPVHEWIDRNVVINFKCANIFNPCAAGVSADRRDLGILLRAVYFS